MRDLWRVNGWEKDRNILEKVLVRIHLRSGERKGGGRRARNRLCSLKCMLVNRREEVGRGTGLGEKGGKKGSTSEWAGLRGMEKKNMRRSRFLGSQAISRLIIKSRVKGKLDRDRGGVKKDSGSIESRRQCHGGQKKCGTSNWWAGRESLFIFYHCRFFFIWEVIQP